MRGVDLLDTDGAGLRVGLCSFGLKRLKLLPVFLGINSAQFGYAFNGNAHSFDLFVGWGRKPSGARAVALSEKHNRPMLLLEDGFLRSVLPNSVSPSPPLSLVIDDAGIFYDASAPSRLEELVTDAVREDQASTLSGRGYIQALKAKKLCKYNDFSADRESIFGTPNQTDRVLVIDQTNGDLSVSGALAGPADFRLMLEAARDENPHAEIIVKTHPETAAGTRAGYLSEFGALPNCRLLAEPVNPWDVFEEVSRVYVVSSQLGFDALMAGLDLRCFGMPFYAGWGLTKDEKARPSSRLAEPTVEHLAAAAYGKYCRYVDPFTQSTSTLPETITTLAHMRDVAQRGAGLGPFVHIYPWNRKTVRSMFQLRTGRRNFISRPANALKHARETKLPICLWSSRADPKFVDQCKDADVSLYRIEDGFVRSVGLGSNFHQPMSLVLDKSGIYYDSSGPSDLENLLSRHEFDEELLQRARDVVTWLKDQNISKYNLSGSSAIKGLPADRLKILVPGQVEDDASVLHSGSGLRRSVDLLNRVRASNPDAFIIFKPHPDVISGQRPGLWREKDAVGLANLFLQGVSIIDAIEVCDQIDTVSSLAGFEGLLRGKQVTCHGMPFYAGWGLTTDLLKCGRRGRRLNLEQLVAGALILYPNYLDPVTQLPCGPEIIIRRILEQRNRPASAGLLVRSRSVLGYLRRLRRGILG